MCDRFVVGLGGWILIQKYSHHENSCCKWRLVQSTKNKENPRISSWLTTPLKSDHSLRNADCNHDENAIMMAFRGEKK
jgi:hypothetical protein